MENTTYQLVEMVPNKHSHDYHSGYQEAPSGEEIEEHASTQGCRFKITRALGSNIINALKLENIQPPIKLTKEDGGFAVEILDRYLSGQLN